MRLLQRPRDCPEAVCNSLGNHGVASKGKHLSIHFITVQTQGATTGAKRLVMFTESFDPADALKVVKCPRCRTAGLEVIGYETFEAAPSIDRHQATCYVDPSVSVRCPACCLVMEWPACLEG